MPQVDPKVTFWFGVWTNVLMLVASYGIEHAPPLVAQYAPTVQWLAGFSYKVNSVVLTALIGLSSNGIGPLIRLPDPPNFIPPVLKVLVAAVTLSLLLAGSSAHAQGLKPLKPLAAAKKSTAGLPCDPANLLPGCKQVAVASTASAATPADALSKLMNDLEKVQADVVTGVVADINAADADAGSLLNSTDPTSFKDPISHACYPAAIKFLQSLPVATPTTGNFIVVQLFQKKRDFVAQIQAGIPVYLKIGCAPLLQDEATIFAKLMGLIGVQVGLNAIAPGIGLAVPAL